MLPPTYVEGFHDLEAVQKMEYKTLGSTGLLISKLSFGGAALGSHFGMFDEDEAVEMVKEGLRRGINYIDTAPYYGQGKSERVLGKALKGVPRQAYYIATKVARYEMDPKVMFDFSAEKTRKSLHESLELLGLDYVDIVQIHDVDYAPTLDIVLSQTLPELAKHVAAGRARHIGITGHTLSVLKECIEKSNVNIQTILNYARLTLIDDTLLSYIPFFKERNIGIISAAAPMMGLLTNDGPPSWRVASANTIATCAKAGKYCKDHNVELGKLAVWYTLQHGDVATHLVGMHSLQVFNMNLDVLINGITEAEKQVLSEIQKKYLSKLKEENWDGLEIAEYKKSLGK